MVEGSFYKMCDRGMLKLLHFVFLEWQSCHSYAEGFGFYQNYYSIEIKAWLYICQFSIFLLSKKLALVLTGQAFVGIIYFLLMI